MSARTAAAALCRGQYGRQQWRPGISVEKHPPSAKCVHLSCSLDDIAAYSAKLRNIAPEER